MRTFKETPIQSIRRTSSSALGNSAEVRIWEDPMILFLLVVIALSLTTVVFLANELRKKFRFMESFVTSSTQLVEYNYPGASSMNIRPGMCNIVLRGERPFSALVGFHLEVPGLGSGFDYYGFVRSDDHGVAVLSTYMGSGACCFQFFVNTDTRQNPIRVTAEEIDQQLVPSVVYPPHWWQRLGFWG